MIGKVQKVLRQTVSVLLDVYNQRCCGLSTDHVRSHDLDGLLEGEKTSCVGNASKEPNILLRGKWRDRSQYVGEYATSWDWCRTPSGETILAVPSATREKLFDFGHSSKQEIQTDKYRFFTLCCFLEERTVSLFWCV